MLYLYRFYNIVVDFGGLIFHQTLSTGIGTNSDILTEFELYMALNLNQCMATEVNISVRLVTFLLEFM